MAQAIWDRFPPAERLVINTTLTCNLACAHCNTESSPRRREHLGRDEMRSVLEAGRRAGKRHVTFSGGEVLLFPAETLEMVTEARRLGYEVDIETNAFWARTAETAHAKLRPFAEAGVAGMCLSADAYHVAYFPVDRTINAARAGHRLGLLVEVNFCPSDDPEVDAAILAALAEAGEPVLHNELLDRGRGRGLVPIDRGCSVAELPECGSLTTTVHATGDVYACCEVESTAQGMKSTPVYLGSLRADTAALDDGPGRLVNAFYDPSSPAYFRRLVRNHPAFRPLADERFVSICDFCIRALSDPARVAAVSAALIERTGS